MTYISELTPAKGERTLTFGGTRAGKSSLTDMTMMQVQHERPTAMQILIDTKPRYRAEKERGRRYTSRKPAAYRYETWEAGPTIPNSCLVDIWDDHPFKGMWDEPGEIAIMQGGEYDDWRRMLQLLKGFVNAQIKGRERRIIVDECLDFTNVTHSELIPAMMCFTVRREREANAESELISERTESTVCLRSSCSWRVGSTCFICEPMRICDTSGKSESRMPQARMATGYSDSTAFNQEARYQSLSREDSRFRTGICLSYQTRKQLEIKWQN